MHLSKPISSKVKANKMTDTNLDKKKHIPAPVNPDAAIEDMLGTIGRLREVLCEETQALKACAPQSFMQLQDRKLAVARDYQEGMEHIMKNKEQIKKATPALKNRLEKERKVFADIAQTNKEAIERMNNGMKRMSERIMKTARQSAVEKQQYAYGASGEMQGAHKASIGINESV